MAQSEREALAPGVALVGSGMVSILLAAGLKSLVLQGVRLQNWLVLLFQINLGRVDYVSLRVLSPLDVLILLFAGVAFAGLWPALARGRNVWISIAVAQPFLGIALLLVTHLLGRSAVMGGGLVAAFLMLRSPGFKFGGWLGIAANSVLLVGDFGTTGSRVPVLSVCIALGYLLLLIWYVWIALASWRQLRHHQTLRAEA